MTPRFMSLAISLYVLGLAHPGFAQGSDGFSVEPIVGIAGSALPVSVNLPASLPSSVGGATFLMFRQVPPEISFSAGFRANQSWLVSINDVKDLMMFSRPGFKKAVGLDVVLHLGKSDRHLSHALRIDLTEPVAVDLKPRNHAGEKPTAFVKPPGGSALQLPEVTELLRRADTLLHAGDFESARLIYSALADNGIAQAAVLMAQTYDPQNLQKNFVVGISPDVVMAMNWYRRAIELGEEGVRNRFDTLASER